MPDPPSQRAFEIFLKVKSARPEERESTLASVCSDEVELRAEVERLLDEENYFPSTVGAVASTPWSEAAAEQTKHSLSGQSIGDYELLAELGKGGMGVVYRARQMSLDRIVAFKVIRTDRDVDALTERFRREAESAAMLDHPNIVPIYEIGEADSLIYFSMKLVEGENLDRMLKSTDSGLQTRVRWIATVARAVHYSHQNGILHRDLKPGNILIDREGIPFVSDFGLAKHLETDVAMTQTGQLLGTPAYMSPEQAKAGNDPVMTTSDIYSLGAILYEAVTGSRVVKATSLADAVLEVIEGSVPAPRSLNPRIDRDLEQICLTCLQKHPSDRYASADALADDLESWLRNEPVRARPLSSTQRLWRWCRRKPAAAATWTAAALFVFVAVGLIIWKWRDAEQQTAFAKAASVEAGIARQNADDESRRARDHFETARKAVANYVMLVDDDVELQRAGLNDLRLDLLESAIPFFEDLVAQEPGDEQAEAGRTEAFFRLAKIQAARGQFEQALARLQDSIQGYRSLSQRYPEESAYREQLAGACNDLAQIHAELGDDEAALAAFDEAKIIQEDLVANSPSIPQLEHELAQFANNFGIFWLGEGDLTRAQQELEQAQEIHARLTAAFPDERIYESDLSRHLFNLGSVFHRADDSERSRKYYLEASRIYRRLAERYPADPEYLQAEYQVQARLAVVCFEREEFDEAQAHYRQTIKFNEMVARRFPTTTDCWVDLARNRKFWAIAQQRLGDSIAARQEYAASVREYQRVVDRFPERLDFRRELASVHFSIASLCSQMKDHSAAEQSYGEAIAIRQFLAEAQPTNRDNLVRLGGAQCNRGNALRKLGRLKDSLVQFHNAVKTLDPIVRSDPNVPNGSAFLINSLCNRAITHERLNHYQDAVDDWKRGMTLDNKSAATTQRWTVARAIVQAQQGQVDEAGQSIEQLIKDTKQNASILYQAVLVYCHCNTAVQDEQRAAGFLDQAMDCLERSHAAGYLTRHDISEQLRTRADFDPLRARKEFNAIVDSL